MGERLLRGRLDRPVGPAARRRSGVVPEPAPAWDDASAVLPPTDDVPEPPDDRDDGLWHSATADPGARTTTPRRRLSLALGGLAVVTLLVSGYAGVQFAGMVGLLPPSPPRYVVLQDQPVQDVRAAHASRPIMVTFGPGFAVHHSAAEVTAIVDLVRREKAQAAPTVAPRRAAPATRVHHQSRSRGSDDDSDDDDDEDRDDEDD